MNDMKLDVFEVLSVDTTRGELGTQRFLDHPSIPLMFSVSPSDLP